MKVAYLFGELLMRFYLAGSLFLCLLVSSCKKDASSGNSGSRTPLVNGTGNQTGAQPPSTTGPIASASNDSALPASCRIAVDCQQALPDFGVATGFIVKENNIRINFKPSVHRARDVVVNEGQDPNLIAKFAYGIAVDADIKGEAVDIYMSKGCDMGWAKIGTQVTSGNEAKRTVDGVEDTGGYIMIALSKLGVSNLSVGRHRFVFVLKGNNDWTEAYVEVLAKKNAFIVTDIDGTLTAFEEAAASEIIGIKPEAHVGAADMIRSFYHRGYNIFYLTARPAFLMAATREWLNTRGFPPGVVHTTNLKAGATGDAAAAFKVKELADLKANVGVVPAYAFGNKPSDVKAFADSGVPTANSYFYKIKGDLTGAKINNDYRTLVPIAQAAPSLCP